MIIARYEKQGEQFNVEIMVLSQGHTYKIAEFACEDEKELKFATENADYIYERSEQ